MVWFQKTFIKNCDDNFFIKFLETLDKIVQDNFKQRKSCKKMQNENILFFVMKMCLSNMFAIFKTLTDARNDNAEQRFIV